MTIQPTAATVRRHRSPTTGFVGRRRQLAEIRERLGAGRVLTLIGPGGVGKTRLARQCLESLGRSYRDGTVFVELEGIADADDIPSVFVHALGIEDQSARDPMDKVLVALAQAEMLIVVDNCEHVLAGAVAVIDAIICTAPAVRILATTRIALGITEEMRYPVPQLAVPNPNGPHTAAGLAHVESVALLVERAAAAVPGFTLTDVNADAVARLCIQLEGLPLAIELAVARMRTLTLDEIVVRLSDRFSLLTTGSRTAEPRQQTLRALIDWSHALCSEAEQQMWARLSVFVGGFDLAAAQGVCGGATDVLDLLDMLLDQSVIYVDPRPSVTRRFRMLETIREYGAEQLFRSGESSRYRDRHRAYFVRRAGELSATWCGPDQEHAAQGMRDDVQNLRAVMDSCAMDAHPETAIELVGALRFRWYADGYIAQGRRWADEALDRPGAPVRPTVARATALWTTAWVCLLQGEPDAARRRIDECDQIARILDDPVAAAYVVKMRALSALFDGDLATAAHRYRQAVTALRDAGELPGFLSASFQYALTLALSGDGDGAQRVSADALAVSAEHDERWDRSYIQWVRGIEHWLRGDLDTAEALGREALALHQVFNQSVGTALMTELLAWVAESSGRARRSAELLGAASALWERTGTTIAALGPGLFGWHAACEARARKALSDAEFDAVARTGAARTVAEIVTLALADGSAAEQPAPPYPATEECPITARQLEIAGLVTAGKSNKDIADALVLSVRTVESHVERSLTRLGLTSRTQLAAWFRARTSVG